MRGRDRGDGRKKEGRWEAEKLKKWSEIEMSNEEMSCIIISCL